MALHGLGIARYHLGDYSAAVEDFDNAIRLARRAGDRTTEGAVQMSVGNTRYFQHQPAAAVEAYDGALEAARATKDRAMEGEALGNLALAYTHLDQYDKAEGYFRQDIAIARERNDRFVEAQALGNLGSMLLQAHRDAEAIQPLSESRDLAMSLHYQRGLAIALRNLGLAQYRTGALAGAEASLRQGIDVQDALRGQAAGADRYNISLFDTQLEAYAHLQAVLVAEHQPEAALEIVERGRGRALADVLSARNGGPAMAPRPTIASIRAVARTRGATLVEYSIVQADSSLYVWVVRQNGEVAFRRISIDTHGGPLDSAFQALVRDTRATLGALGPKDIPTPRPGIAGSDEMLGLFHRILIAPIADLLPAEPDQPVVLIPQGSLFLLPFAALRDTAGKPLVAAHALSVAPSIQALDLLGTNVAATGTALVVGNPALGPIRLDPGSGDETMLPSLPEAEREAQTVAGLLGGQALVGAAATRKTVVDRMAGAGTIHLATHGIAEDVRGRGQPGALALAPDPDDDGLLSTGDIMALRLHAGLVVLSACNTGLGNLTGDGVIGLSRAFLAAGARSVMVSLWYVPDRATADLMEAFYRSLARTHQRAVALRAAMLETQAKHPDPLAWAGFLLVGDGT
jgi:tetratricopeptide (TPR) repeat protein